MPLKNSEKHNEILENCQTDEERKRTAELIQLFDGKMAKMRAVCKKYCL